MQAAFQPFLASILALPKTKLHALCCHPVASHVASAILNGPTPHHPKAQLIRRLAGGFFDAALSPSGTFVVEHAYVACDVASKEVVVEELAARAEEIAERVPLLARNLRVE